VSDLAAAIAQAATTGGAALRSGRVLGIAGTTLTVDVGGGQLVAMPYADAYTPILGDTVQIIQQGAVSFVIGRAAGMPTDNVLANPSFEVDAVATATPRNWTPYFPPGNTGTLASQVVTASQWGAADGAQIYEIYMTVAGSAIQMLVSDQIPVAYGQVWTAAASWQGYADGVTAGQQVTPVAQLFLTWQANLGDAYPTVSSPDTLLMAAAGVSLSMPWWGVLRELSGTGQPVPAGASFMRVALYASHDTTGGMWFDKVICRQLL
jgi:hypothetical protein